MTYWLSSTLLKNLQKLSTFFEFVLSKINIFISLPQQMLVQGPTSILISNYVYHHLTKNIITFFHHFLTFFKEKSTFLKILITTKWWSFDYHFPPSLLIVNIAVATLGLSEMSAYTTFKVDGQIMIFFIFVAKTIRIVELI